MLVNPKPVTNVFGHRDIVDLLIGWIKDKYISPTRGGEAGGVIDSGVNRRARRYAS